jgi:hypothetical protein
MIDISMPDYKIFGNLGEYHLKNLVKEFGNG